MGLKWAVKTYRGLCLPLYSSTRTRSSHSPTGILQSSSLSTLTLKEDLDLERSVKPSQPVAGITGSVFIQSLHLPSYYYKCVFPPPEDYLFQGSYINSSLSEVFWPIYIIKVHLFPSFSIQIFMRLFSLEI